MKKSKHIYYDKFSERNCNIKNTWKASNAPTVFFLDNGDTTALILQPIPMTLLTPFNNYFASIA